MLTNAVEKGSSAFYEGKTNEARRAVNGVPDKNAKPEKNARAEEPKDEYIPGGKPDGGSGGAIVSTDKVNAEIERYKEEVKRLQQQMNGTRNNKDERKELEQQLSQANSALSAKDNDGYRRANASVSYF